MIFVDSKIVAWSYIFFWYHVLKETYENEMRFGYSFSAVKVYNSKHEIRNPKWFDRLTILSKVEGQF